MEAEKKLYRLHEYRLQFFAKEGAGGEKTEEATPKKLEDARKEGQTARSQELTTSVALLGLFLILKIFVGYIGTKFAEGFTSNYERIPTFAHEIFTTSMAAAFFQDTLVLIMVTCLPVFASGLLLALVVDIFQVKWKISGKPLQPKFEKINPLKGFKRIFSLDKVVELIKSILKVTVIVILAYSTLSDEVGTLNILYELGLEAAVMLIGDIVINLGLKISAVFFVIGLADLIYQKFKFKKDMRMTKQEIKDEYKQSEGDPQLKGKIKQKMREASQRRMMQRLPEADVVITNPTHLACAILYKKESSEAPVLVAKGADFLAMKIKEIAREAKIPIVENKPLARMLYANVDLEREIPKELYQMTAEVLAYVYGLQGK